MNQEEVNGAITAYLDGGDSGPWHQLELQEDTQRTLERMRRPYGPSAPSGDDDNL